FGSACGINGAGQVVGNGWTVASGTQHGMFVDAGAASAVNLQGPGGETAVVTTCAVDAAGLVGGQADLGSGLTHAMLFHGNAAVDVDTFGSRRSNVAAVAAGLGVGWYALPDSTPDNTADDVLHAFAHSDADGSFDLNSRIDDAAWVLSTGDAVNV